MPNPNSKHGTTQETMEKINCPNKNKRYTVENEGNLNIVYVKFDLVI